MAASCDYNRLCDAPSRRPPEDGEGGDGEGEGPRPADLHRLPRIAASLLAALSLCALVGFGTLATSARHSGSGAAVTSGATPRGSSGIFLQIADVHLDPWYDGSLGKGCFCNADEQTEGQDCRRGATGNAFGQAGCDSPPPLVEATFRAAAAAAPPGGYDFVLLTGDYTRHRVGRHFRGPGPAQHAAGPRNGTGSEEAKAAVRRIVQQVISSAEQFFPNTALHRGLGYEPLVLGNNDFARDYGLPLTDPEDGANPWLSFLAAKGSPLFLSDGHGGGAAGGDAGAGGARSPLDDATTWSTGGYGMRRLSGSLYLVSLNTIVYSSNYPWDAQRDDDPFGQFAWLERALAWLRSRRQGGDDGGRAAPKALLTGHIPPTLDHYHFKPLWSEEFAERYMRLAAAYDDVIAGQLFAHTHCDTFRVLPSANISHPLFISSALSPVYENNPSFRVWRYDGSELLDYTVYAAELDPRGPQTHLDFGPLYSARSAYGLAALSSAEWRAKVADRLTQDDEVWGGYVRRLWQRASGAKVEEALRDRAFRSKSACAVAHALRADFEACVASLDGDSGSGSGGGGGGGARPASA